jgi:hypothetical protein
LYFKLKQIEHHEYNWLDETVLGQCKHRLLTTLDKEIELSLPSMEEDIITYGEDTSNAYIDQCLDPYFPNDAFRFCARTDLITENVVWELKCTNELLPEHFIQMAIYAWILRTIEPSFSRDFKLFNIRTGEIWKLNCEKSVLDHIVVELLKSKYIRGEMANDSDFITNCRDSYCVVP